METMIFEKGEFPPIIINMFDQDPHGKEFIGSCRLDVEKGIREKWVTINDYESPIAAWHELEYGLNFSILPIKFKS